MVEIIMTAVSSAIMIIYMVQNVIRVINIWEIQYTPLEKVLGLSLTISMGKRLWLSHCCKQPDTDSTDFFHNQLT